MEGPFWNGGLPEAPFVGSPLANGGFGVEEEAVGHLDDISVAVGPGKDCIAKAPPLRWELRGEAASKDPVKLTAQSRGDGEENELGNTAWIGFCIGERQDASPGAA